MTLSIYDIIEIHEYSMKYFNVKLTHACKFINIPYMYMYWLCMHKSKCSNQ